MAEEHFAVSTMPIASLTSFNDAVREIRSSIHNMREYIKDKNLNDPAVKAEVAKHLAHMRLFYGQAERLCLDGDN